MSKSHFIWIVVLTLITQQGIAQNLSIEDCRKLAIENNKTLKIASEQEKVAYYEKRDALTKFFPQLSFSGTYLRNQKNIRLIDPASIPSSIAIPPIPPVFPGGDYPIDGLRNKLLDATEVDIKNVWVGGFNLSQPIFMGGKIIAYNDLRSYAQELAKVQADSKLTDVIADVDNAYWQVVSLANKKRLASAYVELVGKMEADITALEEEGLATKADRLSVSVKLNEAEMTQTRANNGLSLSKMLLAQICGLEINGELTLRDEDSATLPTVQDLDEEVLNIDEALYNRKELKSLDLASKIFEKKEKIALAEFMPQIGLSANYLWTNPSSFNGFSKKFGGMWSIGVGVNVPLNFVSSSSKLKVAKAETRIKRFEFEDAKEKIVLQVNQQAFKLTEANKKLITAKKNTDKADENLRYANVGFEEGVITASDALAAHTAWLSAHAELIDAQIDLKLCRLYLNKALGRNLQ